MGNGANLVVVENGEWSLHYAHWAGCRMLDALAFGAEHAVRYVKAHRLCPKDQWTDPLWADGGALVDVDSRRLLFFGDELMSTMPERRAMLEVLGARHGRATPSDEPTVERMRLRHTLVQFGIGRSDGTVSRRDSPAAACIRWCPS